MQTVAIPILPLTTELFQPYGQLLTARESEPDFHGLQSTGWKANYTVTGDTLIFTLRSFNRGNQFSMLERHFDVSQTFIPLGVEPALVAVAPPTEDRPPEPDQVVAFRIDGSCGYILNPGTWHSLDRYPISGAYADVVMITGSRTQEDIVSNANGTFELSEQVDYKARFNVIFEFDPGSS